MISFYYLYFTWLCVSWKLQRILNKIPFLKVWELSCKRSLWTPPKVSFIMLILPKMNAKVSHIVKERCLQQAWFADSKNSWQLKILFEIFWSLNYMIKNNQSKINDSLARSSMIHFRLVHWQEAYLPPHLLSSWGHFSHESANNDFPSFSGPQ